MSGKHTPGPWSEGIEGNNRVYGPDGMGEHSGLIAVVHKGRSNIHLIAAAPCILKELRHLVQLLEPLERDGSLNVPGLATLNGARAAIAKATGS